MNVYMSRWESLQTIAHHPTHTKVSMKRLLRASVGFQGYQVLKFDRRLTSAPTIP